MTQPPDDAALVARSRALLQAVAFLDAAAGAGIGYELAGRGTVFADEVIYDLFNAYLPGWNGEGEYEDVARAALEPSDKGVGR